MICTVSGLGRVKGLPGLYGGRVQVDRKQIRTYQITEIAVNAYESK